jgi:alpha-L-fucosidase
VGPTPEGTIQPEFQERLRGIGEWLKANGESIYGTTFGPLQDLSFGKSTAKGGTIYLHVFDWPKNGKLEISGLEAKVKDVRLLARGTHLHFVQTENGLSLDVPVEPPDTTDTVISLKT